MQGRIDLKILHYAYVLNKEGPVLLIKGRDKNLKPHVVSIFDMEHLAPRFGILKTERELHPELKYLYKTEDGPPSLYGEETSRIYTQFPWQVPKIRDKFSWTFQADIKWEKMAISEIIRLCGLESPYINIPIDYPYRYLKVEDIKNVPEERRFKVIERISYWDIEIDGRQATQFDGFKDAHICPIISITCYDNYDKIYHQFIWHSTLRDATTSLEKKYKIEQKDKDIIIPKIKKYNFNNEKDMIKCFFSHFSLTKYDDLLGYWSEGGYKKLGKSKKWNNGFDTPFLYERSKFLGLLDEMQKMSPFNSVYSRNYAGKYEVVIAGLGQIDWVFSNEVLQVNQKYYDFRGGRLADWMAYFTDFDKLDKEGHQPVYFWLKNDLKFLLDYNLIDVWGLVELDKRFDMSGKQRGRCDVALSPLQDGIMASKLHDHAKLTIYQQDYAFDTKYYGGDKYRKPLKGKKQIGEQFTLTLRDLEKKGMGAGQHYETLYDIHKVGGYVKDIQPGVYEDIAVIDFTKYYPNMIKSCNAGILPLIDFEKESLISVWDSKGNKYSKKDIIETPVAYFRKDIKSLNSIIFDMWLDRRVKAQAKLREYLKIHKTTKTEEYERLWVEQFNLKNFMNAYFGILGLPIDRGYNKLAFNACTMSCQDVIRMCLKKVIEREYTVIGGDTDSLFLKLKAKDRKLQIIEAEGLCNYLNMIINEYLDKVYNVQDNTISIGLETISDKVYVDVPKHYIKRNWYVDGQVLDKPELEIKGMDLKKRATSQVAADLQKRLAHCLFYEKDPLGTMREYAVELDSSLEGKDWDYLCKRAPLQKRIDKYPESNESATAAKNAIKYLGTEFKPGDNPFLGVFKDYPTKINGKFVESHSDLKVSFYKEDIPKLKKLGFKLNYDNIRSTQLFAKSEHVLAMFGEDWGSLVEAGNMGDMMML